MQPVLRPFVAEAVGTFYLCFIGAGSICVNAHLGAPGYGLLGIALAHGLALSIGVSATMAVSGGHLNPAVSIAMFFTGRLGVRSLVAYVMAQLTGAVVAGALLRWMFPAYIGAEPYLGVPGLGKDMGPGMAVGIEAILTFLLLFSIFGTAVDPRAPRIAGFGIGLTVGFDILVGGPLTGAAMNPARHLGIALVAGRLDHWWIYWVGPVLGALGGAFLYDRVILAPPRGNAGSRQPS